MKLIWTYPAVFVHGTTGWELLLREVAFNTFVPIGVLLLRGLSRQQSGRSTITPPFSKTC